MRVRPLTRKGRGKKASPAMTTQRMPPAQLPSPHRLSEYRQLPESPARQLTAAAKHIGLSMMRPSTLEPRKSFAGARRLVLLLVAAGLLAGCEATGSGMGPAAKLEAGKPAEPPKIEPPMTRSRAAEQCWMGTEKGSAGVNIDKRADTVTKCIDDKMKAAAAAPKT
jgi:hypothetical protein